jgi:hypothetical protein
LVLYDSGFDVIVCFISSVLKVSGEFDIEVLRSEMNGLKAVIKEGEGRRKMPLTLSLSRWWERGLAKVKLGIGEF